MSFRTGFRTMVYDLGRLAYRTAATRQLYRAGAAAARPIGRMLVKDYRAGETTARLDRETAAPVPAVAARDISGLVKAQKAIKEMMQIDTSAPDAPEIFDNLRGQLLASLQDDPAFARLMELPLEMVETIFRFGPGAPRIDEILGELKQLKPGLGEYLEEIVLLMRAADQHRGHPREMKKASEAIIARSRNPEKARIFTRLLMASEKGNKHNVEILKRWLARTAGKG